MVDIPNNINVLPEFYRQHFFVLDAFGTLIKPKSGVIEVYHRMGRMAGSQLSHAQVLERFKTGRRKFFAPVSDTDLLQSSDSVEKTLWRQLVKHVFHDARRQDDLFDKLWHHFSLPSNWMLFEDVADFVTRLNRECRPFAIASNFDSRLDSIVEASPELSSAVEVYCSARVGFRKPSAEFYRAVGADLAEKFDTDRILMIGDDLENDVNAPRQFGWDAVHLDRKPDSPAAACDGFWTIRSLQQL